MSYLGLNVYTLPSFLKFIFDSNFRNPESEENSTYAINNTNLTDAQDIENKEQSKQPEIPRYEWKVITEEFFEAVQGKILSLIPHK